MLDTATGRFSGRCLHRRPTLTLEIFKTGWEYWQGFKEHHYLDLPPMIGGICYVGTIDGEMVCHIGVSTVIYGRNGFEARACRCVVMPEWQGIGVGTRFIDSVCELQMEGGEGSVWPGLSLSTIFHTSHPGLCRALRNRRGWVQVSGSLYGEHKGRSAQSLGSGTGYGGHLRAVQGFRYIGKGTA